MASKKNTPTWSDVKTKLADFDRAGLLGLVQDMYAASKDNQNFLHARFSVGNVLGPYKATIERWPWPMRTRTRITPSPRPRNLSPTSRRPSASRFSDDVGLDDDSYYDALVRMFGQALKMTMTLPEAQREPFLDRLEDIRAWGLARISTPLGSKRVWILTLEEDCEPLHRQMAHHANGIVDADYFDMGVPAHITSRANECGRQTSVAISTWRRPTRNTPAIDSIYLPGNKMGARPPFLASTHLR